MKKKLLLISALLLFATGCTASIPQNDNNSRLANGTVIINNGKEKTFTNLNVSNLIKNHAQQRDYDHKCAETRAENIATTINNIKGIKKAAVVVSGSKAIVGLTLEQELNDKDLIKLKHQVDSTAKKIDSNITRTAVSTAPDLFERMLDLSGGNDEIEKEALQTQEENDTLFRLIPTI